MFETLGSQLAVPFVGDCATFPTQSLASRYTAQGADLEDYSLDTLRCCFMINHNRNKLQSFAATL